MSKGMCSFNKKEKKIKIKRDGFLKNQNSVGTLEIFCESMGKVRGPRL